ncbi:bifunctional phosphoribosylaminoimidazolecarboxamide formyltransferase/IMP cyclohydrolase [Zavarzinia aquatilis]|uniref:Bifunctional purine biosynthesis protein PurH n=1 Tax=Zavarzinia aquatilis TaxID=2211142 RepID=A0A317E5R7_9PROT|nr:bifunctional phosphoribosylaminoimidazolecarboxamide formyltransferase/IMP cyclohydrolase [Zavarzinia aquatilis]PWR22458.1 bifunctional phosphoribosylaminoimidazolecarboxamide formyltransferase/inosine monophosphate cyclohydrolase [Zavarzinia aquatilis]
MIARALLSVSDKTGLVPFALALADRGVELLSTGGTAKALRDAGLPVIEVADYTGSPEILDGRVKTLHPKVHGGLLGRRDVADHVEQMNLHGIGNIDLVVVNLYPFEATVARGADWDETIENIDIGGPAMIRSAAKNHDHVTVVVEPADYQAVLDDLAAHGGATTLALRRKLAAKAYARTASYDAAISGWFAKQLDDTFPERLTLSGSRASLLRYGENPHQAAALYVTGEKRPGVATARQLQGKELSYNNLNDTDAAFELVAEFDPKDGPAVVIVKHANPCGVATGESLLDAWDKALMCDPVSAFGGIVAVNSTLDRETAEAISKIFTEVIVAPEADEDAIAVLSAKKNLRLLITGGLPDPKAPGLTAKTLAGALLVQTRDAIGADGSRFEVKTRRTPSEQEVADMEFAVKVAKHVKSNTIVFVKNGATVGIGAGQMSRVDSARIAFRKAQDAARTAGLDEPLTKGSVAASDAFFPFADGLDVLVEAGATAVAQPGGSIRDAEVIAAADAAGLAMVFTGERHFRH